MNPLKTISTFGSKILQVAQKFFTVPTISGGFSIFSGETWDGSFSKTKALGLYGKSVYVYACVSKIAQKTASIDWQFYRIKNRAGDKQELFIHEAIDLLYKPNPFQTKGEFFERFIINKKLAGEAFILKVRKNGPGSKVVELWNLRPDLVTIIKDRDMYIKGYEFQTSTETVFFSPEDIIYDSSPNPLDEFSGMSAIFAANTRVETELNAVSYQRNFFKNNARPDFILKVTNKVTNQQKEEIKESWEKRHKGALASGRGAFLEGGMEYQQISISQREMDYIESLKMTRDDILTAFGVPKPIVAITDDVNLANAQTAMQIFISETIVPEIKRLTERLNEDLISPEFGDVFYIDFIDPTPSNIKEKAEIQQIQIQSGVLLINEAREELGLDPIKGGDTLYQPISNIAVGGKTTPSEKTIKGNPLTIFKGRKDAYKFLEIREEVEKMVYGAAYKKLGIATKSASNKITTKGMRKIVPEEIRLQFADSVNKAIDNKSESYKKSILNYADDQKSRVIAELKSDKSFNSKALKGLFDIAKESKLFAEISIPFITEFVVSAGKEALQTITPQNDFEVTDAIKNYIKERAKIISKQINDTTLDKLSSTLAEGIDAGEGIADLTKRVESVYDEYPTYRAESIARTETTAANNKGFTEGYRQSGVANAKEWIATNDSRTRDSHAHADGEVVKLDDSFSNGLDYPGDPKADPAETINCRCVLAPAWKE